MRVFGYRIFLIRSSVVGFYVLWLARGEDGQSRRVAMGSLMATEACLVWSGPVWSCLVCSGRWGGLHDVVGVCGRFFWLEHGPVQDGDGVR